MINPIGKISERIAYQFNNPELLQSALTHRSAGSQHNERLEFLGDSILNFVIAETLFVRFPEATEGELSRLRASLVKESTLALLARELDLGDFLVLGSGELKSGGFRRDSILADALEAIFGSVLLDTGFDQARQVILNLYESKLETITLQQSHKDPKSKLQEYLQSRRLPLPQYEILSVSGEPHNQSFKVSCRVDELDLATEGKGSSRRRAEQDAATLALKLIEKKES
ncbi:MAG: ribonuclease III [Gammaproteobacteria bacterium]|nr:ribonuclease III [Gammaproteobacteria bacterium]